MAIQIGKYRRPGIFTEEFDESIIVSPTVDGITNTVIGFSKKGPVNTPILLNNINDLERVYGPLDRSLERKGSYFHRTIAKALESSPVFAVNLLLTNDNLDRIEYQSLSCASTIQNDVKKIAPYRRFFDTTGFWKRDTESFLNIVGDTNFDKLLNFTNLSDKHVSIFIFKSKRTGFDRPLLEWYGSIEKLPPYLNAQDLASDYLVDVLVVSGDYSDYRSLSVDPRFSNYFSPTGLRKDSVRNFSNDRNVSTLAFAEGLSLIPYFRDLNGQNIFIETAINRGTDKHGVFCAFNMDLFETDYPNNLIDLIGNGFVNSDLSNYSFNNVFYGSLDEKDENPDGDVNINFLSYKEKVTETVAFKQTPLDRPGNVFALFGTSSIPSGDHSFKSVDMDQVGGILDGYINNPNRTYWFNEGFINDVYVSSLTYSNNTIEIVYDVDSKSNNGYAVIGGEFVKVENTKNSGGQNGVITINSNYWNNDGDYHVALTLDKQGQFKLYQTTKKESNPLVGSSDLVLGWISITISGGSIINYTINDVTLYHNIESGGTQFKPLEYGVDYQYEYFSDKVKIFFPNTTNVRVEQYEKWRRVKTFNTMLNFLNSSNSFRGCLLLNPLSNLGNNTSEGTIKFSLSDIKVSNVKDSNMLVKSFDISFTPPSIGVEPDIYVEDDLEQYFVPGYMATFADLQTHFQSFIPLVIYKTDDEFILGKESVITKNVQADLDEGVAAKYSSFYQSYQNGLIRTSDVVYQKVNFTPLLTQFINGESINDQLSGYDYLVFGVPKNFSDIYGNTASELIKENEDFFLNEVNDDYQFLITGGKNSGAFKTKSDSSLDKSQNEFITISYSYPMNSNQRALVLDSFSGGILGFGSTQSDYRYYAFEIEQNVQDEVLTIQNLFAYSKDFEDRPIYLDLHLDSSENLVCTFEDELLDSSVKFKSTISNNITYVKSFNSNFKQSLEVEVGPTGYVPQANKVLVNAARYTEVKVGDYLEAAYYIESLEFGEYPRKLTRILSKRTLGLDPKLVEITCDSEIKLNNFGSGDIQTFRYTKLDDYVSTYKSITLKGFRVRNESMPDGTEARQNSILNLVAKSTPLFRALTNKEAFDFRYLVDSFGLGLTENSKQQLVDICGERLDCFGILNMPSMKQFKNSSSPQFVDLEGVLQTEFIASGGNLETNPAFLYTFGQGRGVSSVGYFAPYVSVNDNGRPVDVPPAAYILSTYMRKHNSNTSTLVPWTIAAGITNGRIVGIAGLEMDFDPQDIENLNLAQMNPIVFKRNRGFVIETENTAQTLYKSSLSFIHSREVLIELERDLSAMLLDFQWKFNTPEVRAEIKLRADIICENYVSKNGLFNYFNKCDEENNTSEIIDNQIGVLSTYVEVIKGMGVIVNNVTILRTGAIQAGGFIES